MAPAGNAQKRKNVASSDKYQKAKRQTVCDALQEVDKVHQLAREMMVACAPNCFPVVHPYQQQLLSLVELSLRGVEVNLKEKVANAEADTAAATERIPALAQEQQNVSDELTATSQALKTEKEALQKANGNLEGAKAIVQEADERLRKCDSQIGTLAMETYQLQEKSAEAAVDEDLLPEEVSSSCSSEIADRKLKLRRAVAERVGFHASASDSQRVCATMQAKLASQQAAVDTTQSSRNACAARLKDAWERVRQAPADQKQCEAELADARAKLKDFQTGALTIVKTEINTFNASEEPQMRSAPKENRRASFADIRKRRSSFLPAKKIEADAKGDKSGAQRDSKKISSVPTPARRS